MTYFAQMKNDADAVLKTLKAKAALTDEDRAAKIKAMYDRTIAKLFLNGLLGRNNMKLDRSQTLITRDPNDVTCLHADTQAFRGVQIEDIQCGDQWAYRARFKEGRYEYHIKNFNVCPYLSAYMLGYSKMLMQASFQYLASIGAVTPQMWKQYSDRFVPSDKTFGGMELEGQYRRFVTIGPKKYCCIKDDGSYEWACNGMPAKSNTESDVLAKFEEVLAGKTVDIDYFSINASYDFNLLHTTGAKKSLRFLSLKGAVEDGRIRWWKDENEFVTYAAGVAPCGWEKIARKNLRKAAKEVPPSAFKVADAASHGRSIALQNVEIKEWRKSRKRPPPDTREHFVYVLTDQGGKGHSYVGYAPNLDRRLNDHNGVNPGKGANATKSDQWQHYAVYEGFPDKKTALRFESLMHLHSVDHVRQWLDVAKLILPKYAEEFGGVQLAAPSETDSHGPLT